MPLPALPDPDLGLRLANTAKETARSLESMVRCYKRDRARIRQLAMFAERTNDKPGVANFRAKAKVEWNDRPEVELILKRIAMIEENQERRSELRREQNREDNDTPLKVFLLARAELDRQDQLHYSHIESVLASLSKEFGQREAMIAGVAMKLAQLAQQMLLAREANAMQKSDQDIIADLAGRYNMSVEEAKALLEAKAVDGIG